MNISVIIPALNEEERIEQTVRKVKEHATGFVDEVIVADGGSRDTTRERAKEAGAFVIEAEQKGRSLQMNEGARHASCNILYFLHADSIPPMKFDQQIIDVIDEGYPAGCFQLAFDRDQPLLNFYAWCTRFDIDALRFGDQSLFIKQELFKQLDGFDPALIVMEDNMMVRTIKKNFSFKIIPDFVITSARKYERVGVIRLQLVFTLIYLLFFWGCSQERLVKIYKKLT